MASEQYGKYYGRDLVPVYNTLSADGKKSVRVTLTHARKMGLLYSVSRVLEESSDFDIVEWQKRQVALACMANPFSGDAQSQQEVENYVSFIAAKADEFRNATADRGKDIHKAIERHLKGEAVDRSDPAIDLSISAFEDKIGEWDVEDIQPERCVGGAKWGCCGQPDVVLKCAGGKVRIVDIKSTDLSKFKSPYTKWLLQLGAYHLFTEGTDTELWQAVVDRNTGEVRFIRHEGADEWKRAFQHLFEYCCIVNNYDPRKAA